MVQRSDGAPAIDQKIGRLEWLLKELKMETKLMEQRMKLQRQAMVLNLSLIQTVEEDIQNLKQGQLTLL